MNLYIFVPKERLNVLYNYLGFRHGINSDERNVFFDYFSLQFSRITGSNTDVSSLMGQMNNEFYNSFISIEAMMENFNKEPIELDGYKKAP